MSKPQVFVSHITEEAKLAEVIQAHVRADFLGMVDIFVSSDGASIGVGRKWLNDIDEALQSAQVMLVLCSEASVKRPWINFEAGAGWVRRIPVVPVCHTGMRRVDLPIPLNMLQAIEARQETGWRQVYDALAGKLGATTPMGDFGRLTSEVAAFEYEYGVIRHIRAAVQALIALVPDMVPVFQPDAAGTNDVYQGEVPERQLDKMLPHLDALQSRQLVEYATAGTFMEFAEMGHVGRPSRGVVHMLRVLVHESYYQLAPQVMA